MTDAPPPFSSSAVNGPTVSLCNGIDLGAVWSSQRSGPAWVCDNRLATSFQVAQKLDETLHLFDCALQSADVGVQRVFRVLQSGI